MTLQQQIQALQDEGYWVSGVVDNERMKRALFYALYQGGILSYFKFMIKVFIYNHFKELYKNLMYWYLYTFSFRGKPK